MNRCIPEKAENRRRFIESSAAPPCNAETSGSLKKGHIPPYWYSSNRPEPGQGGGRTVYAFRATGHVPGKRTAVDAMIQQLNPDKAKVMAAFRQSVDWAAMV